MSIVQKHGRTNSQEIGAEEQDELNDIQIRLKNERASSGGGGGGGTSSRRSPPDPLSTGRNLNTLSSVTSVTAALVTLPSPSTVELESRTPSPKSVGGGKQPAVRISTL